MNRYLTREALSTRLFNLYQQKLPTKAGFTATMQYVSQPKPQKISSKIKRQ